MNRNGTRTTRRIRPTGQVGNPRHNGGPRRALALTAHTINTRPHPARYYRVMGVGQHTRSVPREQPAPERSERMALPHSSQRGIKWDAPSGGSGFESRRRPPSAPLDGARSTRRVPGGRTPKYPLRPWVHTRGGNHQSVPGRKVEVGGSYARPTPRTYVGGTICRGGDRRHLWLTTIKKKAT